MKKNILTRPLAFVLVAVMALGTCVSAYAEVSKSRYDQVVTDAAYDHWEKLMTVKTMNDYENVREGLTDENTNAVAELWPEEEFAATAFLEELWNGWGVYTAEERATFTKGYYVNGEKLLGEYLQNALASLSEKEFNFAVNQMDKEQYDAFFEECANVETMNRAYQAIVHTGFPVSNQSVLNTRAIKSYNARATAEPVWPAEGSIYLDKTATSIGDNEWEVTLTIKGMNYKTTSDVVLVMDISSSMDTNDRIGKAKNAAQAFVEKLLVEGGSTRVALVTYDGSVRESTRFYSSSENDRNELLTIINAIDTGSGTFTQGGLHKADEILKSGDSIGVLKNIVLLSDGEPRTGYNLTGTATVSCNENSNYNRHRFGSDYVFSDYTFDYENSGGTDYLTVTCTCPRTNTVTFANSGWNIDTAWIATKTILEATQIKENGVTIYSIALQAGSTGEEVMQGCATDPSKGYFEISNNDNIETTLNAAFNAIAGSIAIAASNAAVTDIMGSKVQLDYGTGNPTYTTNLTEYNAGSYDIYVSQGTITGFNSADEQLDWNVGNINEGTDAVMKYRIKLDDGYNPTTGTTLFANESAKFIYTDYQQQSAEKEFPKPPITVGGGGILVHWYLVNEDGEPININGESVGDKKLAYQLDTASPYLNPETNEAGLNYNTPYTVAYKEFADYTYFGKYNLNDGELTTGDQVQVTVTASHSNQNVWFAYYIIQNGSLTINKTVEDQTFNGGTFSFAITPPEGEALPDGITSPVTVTIAEGETTGSITLEDLPAGTYTIVEQGAELYDTTIAVNGGTATESKTVEVEVPAGEATTVEYTNTRKLATLTITKTGMQANETAIFDVAVGGTHYTVAIPANGNGSATITNLVVGASYTVNEVRDWTWRYQNVTYTADGVENSNSGSIKTDGSNVAYANDNRNDKWLHDESYEVNFD